MTRRNVLAAGVALAAGASAAGVLARTTQPGSAPPPAAPAAPPLFTISLAEWSLHRALKGGRMTNLDFARVAREDYAIDAIEYVNTFFEKRTPEYLAQLNQRASDHAVTQVLIMCDGEGNLGDPDPAARTMAIENHRFWVDAAATLGCHSIRVNAASRGTYDEQQKLAADGLRRLAEVGATRSINVIVENHGGLSSNGAWLAGVIRLAAHPRLGTLPDFGNFDLSPTEKYDRYKGVGELVPFARGVSAKSHEFDADGNEVFTDYRRMLRIVLDAGYRGRIGIEYEGEKHSEPDGIRLTKSLLEKVRAEIAK